MFCAFIIFCSCEQDPKIAAKKLTAQDLKNQLNEIDCSDSLNYISAKLISFEQNLIMTRSAGVFRSAEYKLDGWIILGEITNSALLANFKDIVISVSYYSQTKSLIDKKDIVIYQFIKPNTSIGFDVKVNPPDGASSVTIAVKSITPIRGNIYKN